MLSAERVSLTYESIADLFPKEKIIIATTTTTDRLITLALLVFLPALLMGGRMMRYRGLTMGWMDGTNTPGWMVVVGLISQLLRVTLVVDFGYLAYRTLTGGETDTALEELRTAFTRAVTSTKTNSSA